MEKKLVPYSVYLPAEYHARIRAAAKRRQASMIVREAIVMYLENQDAYRAGYIRGVRDAAEVVYKCPEAQMVAVKGKDIGAFLTEQIRQLEEP
jgi:predicted transcriptional regulator